jgi:3-hydroxyacyl-CoA dehydrogenase
VWDAIGVRRGAELMQERGIVVAPWVEAMLAAGIESFYRRDGGRVTGVFSPVADRIVALALVAAGYTPPPPGGEPVYAMGKRGIAVLQAALYGMRQGGFISDYDKKLATALASTLCGGDLSSPQWVTEQYILDLEFEETAKLIVEPKTQERIMAILQNGKPLRN